MDWISIDTIGIKTDMHINPYKHTNCTSDQKVTNGGDSKLGQTRLYAKNLQIFSRFLCLESCTTYHMYLLPRLKTYVKQQNQLEFVNLEISITSSNMQQILILG
jgi:hypothetical protein